MDSSKVTLVPLKELKVGEYIYRVKLDVSKQFESKKAGHLFSTISALLNTSGGIIQVEDEAGRALPDEDFDKWRNKLVDSIQKFVPTAIFSHCISVDIDAQSIQIKVRRSKTFITTQSNMFIRGFGETKQVFHHYDLYEVMSQATKTSNRESFHDQDLRYKGTCTLVEGQSLEFKCFQQSSSSVDNLMKRIKDWRCFRTCFALPNLAGGGSLIIGIRDRGTGGNVFIGQELSKEEETKFRSKLATALSDERHRWGNHNRPIEGVHWECRIIPLEQPMYHNASSTESSGRLKRRVLIEIYFPHCPGGVFMAAPEAYRVTDDGTIEKLSFEEWKEKHIVSPQATKTEPRNRETDENSEANADISPDFSQFEEEVRQDARFKDHAIVGFRKNGNFFPEPKDNPLPEVLHPERNEMFQMSSPIKYTPPRHEIEHVLNGSDLLEHIDRQLKKAFGIASNTLHSCIKKLDFNPARFPDLCAATNRPPHHVVDLFLVTHLVSLFLFVVCSEGGSESDQQKQRIYGALLARTLKKRLCELGETFTGSCSFISVTFQVLYTDKIQITDTDLTQNAQPENREQLTDICRALTIVLFSVPAHFKERIGEHQDIEFAKEQLDVLVDTEQCRFNFIEGPPGCGKTILAQHLCEKLCKSKSVYVTASIQLANMVNHKGKAHARQVESGQEFIKLLLDLEAEVKHVVVDDAHNMRYSHGTFEMMFEVVDAKDLHLHVFQDSMYQNFKQFAENQLTFKKYLEYSGRPHMQKPLQNIRRNARVVGAFLMNIIPDVLKDHGIRNNIKCAGNVMGDDVMVRQVSKLLTHDSSNGLIAYVKEILKPKPLDSSACRYYHEDVAILTDHKDPQIKQGVITSLRNTFTKFWSESRTQGAELYPVNGIIIDSLDNFMGLEARVVVFVVLKWDATQEARTFVNPKYKIAIASRGIERVDFVKEENLILAEVQQLKFNQNLNELLENEHGHLVTASWSLNTKRTTTDLAVAPQSGLVFMCHPAEPTKCLSCVTTEGRDLPTPFKLHSTNPHGVAVNAQTGDLVLVCEGGEDGSERFLTHYRMSSDSSWEDRTHHKVGGRWSEYGNPCISWLGAESIIMGIKDSENDWCLVIWDIHGRRELHTVKTVCEEIIDLSVAPESDTLYVCDAVTQTIHVFSDQGMHLREFSVTIPGAGRSPSQLLSLCVIRGGRILVCHMDAEGDQYRWVVTLHDRNGGHLNDVVTSLHEADTYRIRVDEVRGHLFVTDEEKGILWKFNANGMF